MHLVFDIFQGIGIATAVGIRPFLPGLVAGALAAGDVEIHFNGSGYGFLQSVPVLFALAVAGFALVAAERGLPETSLRRRPAVLTLAGLGLIGGALFFAAALARGHYAAWPGYPAGILCAAVGVLATRPLLERVRGRLDAAAAAGVSFFAELSAVLLAALSIVAPPVGPLALAALVWLLVAGRRRAEQKYAGLRILR